MGDLTDGMRDLTAVINGRIHRWRWNVVSARSPVSNSMTYVVNSCIIAQPAYRKSVKTKLKLCFKFYFLLSTNIEEEAEEEYLISMQERV